MAYPLLRRFETTIYRDNGASDMAQVPFVRASVDFYRQGATVAEAGAIDPGMIATVLVYSPGELSAGDVVSVGVGGAPLFVDQPVSSPAVFPGPVQVRLKNNTLAQVSLAEGTRLLVLSRRPEVYLDATGQTSLGQSVITGTDGRVGVYVALQRFDYVVRGTGVVSTSSEVLPAGKVLSWSHVEDSKQSAVLVGISWNDAEEEPAVIQSVKYGPPAGPLEDMTPVASGGYCAVYKILTSTPAGPKTVEVRFSHSVRAVGGAVGFTNMDANSFSVSAVAISAGTNPAATLVGASPASQVLGVLTVNTGAPGVTATPNGMDQRWNQQVGSGISYCLGAGASGDAGSSAAGWTLSEPANWEVVAVEARPILAIVRLHADAQGGAAPNPNWINARDFATLENAVSAVPESGGEVFLPQKTYIVGNSLVLGNANVVLRGENQLGTLIQREDSSFFDMLVVNASDCRILNLHVFGLSNGENPGSCLKVSSEVERCYLENLTLERASEYGLLMRDVLSLVALNVECYLSRNAGALLQRTLTTPWDVRLIGCSFFDSGHENSNPDEGPGVKIQGGGLSGDATVLIGCGMEGNKAEGATQGNGITVENASGVQLVSTYFELRGTGAADVEQFLYATGAKGLIAIGNWGQGKGPGATEMIRRIAAFAGGSEVVAVNTGGYNWKDEMMSFDLAGNPAVELGNYFKADDSAGSAPTLAVGADSPLFGLSQKTMQVFRYATATPLTPNAGAMRWVDSPASLQVFDGTFWRHAVLS